MQTMPTDLSSAPDTASHQRMLPYTEQGSGKITLILMHYLGGSRLEWTETLQTLAHRHRCIAVDLPGFGEAANISGFSVNEMAEAVLDLLGTLSLGPYVLVGHGMSGMVAAVVARRLLDDPARHAPPLGLVLVAPSPPGPDPIPDSRRRQMLFFLGEETGLSTEEERIRAKKFIHDNVARDVPEAVLARTLDDILRTNRAAWKAWVTYGSREDWSDRIGVIDLPTLIVTGNQDDLLGPGEQNKLTMPHFSAAHQIVMSADHLIPLEDPAELSCVISNFLQVF